jgi:proteasome lid subunit RPN8/RPN11
MPKLKLSRQHLDALVAHAREAAPAECCGLIGGSADWAAQSIYRMRNVAGNPEVTYEAAPEDLFAAQRQMREREETLLAIYHSHPRSSEPNPSQTDVKQAFYPSAVYLIVGFAGKDSVVRGFRISERDNDWNPVEYALVDE